VFAVESSELVGDIGDAPDCVTVSNVVITVAALSIRQWNVFFGLLTESMFRRMKGVKGEVRLGQRGHG